MSTEHHEIGTARIVDLEAGREVEQHMVRYAAVQVEEAKRQRDAALSLLDRKTADAFALSRLLRGMARRTAVLRGKLLDEYLPDRGASRAPREPCERQDYDVDGLRQQLAAVKALAERWDFSAPVGASQLRCALDGRSGDGGYSGGSPGDLNRVAADLMERHGYLPLSMRYAMASAILDQQARNARVSTAAGPPGEPSPPVDTRPRAEHPCPDPPHPAAPRFRQALSRVAEVCDAADEQYDYRTADVDTDVIRLAIVNCDDAPSAMLRAEVRAFLAGGDDQ